MSANAPRTRRYAVVKRHNYYAGTISAPADYVVSWHETATAAEAERQRLEEADADQVYHLRHGEHARPEFAVMTRAEAKAAGDIEMRDWRPTSMDGAIRLQIMVAPESVAKLDEIAAERNESRATVVRRLIDEA